MLRMVEATCATSSDCDVQCPAGFAMYDTGWRPAGSLAATASVEEGRVRNTPLGLDGSGDARFATGCRFSYPSQPVGRETAAVEAIDVFVFCMRTAP
jgi:hypothetical protein